MGSPPNSPINSPRVNEEIKHKYSKGMYVDGPLKIGSCAVFCGETTLNIHSVSASNPAVITTTTKHGLRENYFYVNISGTGADAAVNGTHLASAMDKYRFFIPVNNTTASGAVGTVNCDSVTIAGNLDMLGNTITDVGDPINDQDAATKAYVDNNGGGGSGLALTYRGTWDASINSPSLSSGGGTQGDYYVVSVAGTTALNGVSDWQVGDWVTRNDTVWEKADHTTDISGIAGAGLEENSGQLRIAAAAAGAGLTGGAGTALDVGAGDGITVNANDVAIAASAAGDGLTLTSGVLDVVGGDGIAAAADSIAVDLDAGVPGLDFNAGKLRISAAAAGAGLTGGANSALAVGAGDGIAVNANDVALAAGVAGTGLSLASGVLSVDASQTQVTGLGTVTTGAWNADTVTVPYGGTGAGTHALGNVLVGAGAGAVTSAKPAPTGIFVGTSDSQTLTNKTINSDFNTLSNISNIGIKAGAAIDAAKIHDGSVSNMEFGYLNGVTGAIQTQIGNKADLSHNHNASDINAGTLPVLRGGTGAATHASGNVLVGAGAGAVTSAKPAPIGVFVGTTDVQTLTNKTMGDSLDAGNFKIVNVGGPPTLGTDAANKAYVDSIASGLTPKQGVKVKTADPLPPYTQVGTGIGATLTANANGVLPAIDGITMLATERVLVDDLGSASGLDNGIYTVTDLGSVGTPWILTRATDIDDNTETVPGSCTFVSEGTDYKDTIWCISSDTIDVDILAQVWVQFSSAGQTTASNVGAGGISVFKQKTGTDLEFNSMNAASNKVTVALDGANNEIDIDLVEGNITIGNLSGAPSGAVVGTTDAQTLSNKTLTLPEINDTSADHQYVMGVSELTANRTTTLPLLTGNDTFVFEAHSQTLTMKTIDSDNNTITNISNADIKALAAIDAAKIAGGMVNNTEFSYLNGVTGAIQTQIGNKADLSHNHNASDITTGTLPVARGGTGAGTHALGNVLVGAGAGAVTSAKPAPTGIFVGTTDIQTLTNKTINSDFNTLSNIANADIKALAAIDAAKIHDGSVSNMEFGYLNGVTGAIQTQIGNKADLSHNHDAGDITTGTLPVARGGTGAATHVSGNVLLGAGTGAVTSAKAAPTGDFVGTTDAQTLSNKTMGSDLAMGGFKATGSASTVVGDLGTTLATKDYVDAAASGGPSITDDHVVTGTGSGIQGEANLQFNASGQLQVPEGSVAAPSYTFLNGTDTGLSCIGGVKEITKMTFGDRAQYEDGGTGVADYFIIHDTMDTKYYVWLRDVASTKTTPIPSPAADEVDVMVQIVNSTDPENSVAIPVINAINAISGTPFTAALGAGSANNHREVNITVNLKGSVADTNATNMSNIGTDPSTSGTGTLVDTTSQGIDKKISVSIAANEVVRVDKEALQIVPTGTEVVPSLYFAGDTNTGIYHPADNVLAFSTNSAERLRITDTNFGKSDQAAVEWNADFSEENVQAVLRARKVDNLVTLEFEQISGTSDVATFARAAGTVPSGFRPQTLPAYFTVMVQDNGSHQMGLLRIGTDGAIEVYPTVNPVSSSWTFPGIKTLFKTSVQYTSA